MSDEIRRRHGSAVAATLFYGSCLRKRQPAEGVLDLYVLVRSYRSAYGSRLLGWSNAVLPPNVFYIELADGGEVIRAKYAVISLEDFARGCKPDVCNAIVWGRFCQPTLLAWVDSDETGELVARWMSRAAQTMVERASALIASADGSGVFSSEALWQRGFAETYKTELRTESAETIASIYRAVPERYDRVAQLVFCGLENDGVLRVTREGTRWHVAMAPERRRRIVTGWRVRRPVAKALYFVRLVKSALTFGDWLPYALWKLNRHTGVTVELSDGQRRHPFLLGWPVILRLLWQQKLR